MGNPGKIHTYTYTPDAAKSTAILGNIPDAYYQEWLVLTTSPASHPRQNKLTI